MFFFNIIKNNFELFSATFPSGAGALVEPLRQERPPTSLAARVPGLKTGRAQPPPPQPPPPPGGDNLHARRCMTLTPRTPVSSGSRKVTSSHSSRSWMTTGTREPSTVKPVSSRSTTSQCWSTYRRHRMIEAPCLLLL
jgi:hypothetical protein